MSRLRIPFSALLCLLASAWSHGEFFAQPDAETVSDGTGGGARSVRRTASLIVE